MEKTFSRKETATILNISERTLDEERKAGRIAYIQTKPNGKVFFTEEHIRDYLSRGTHPVRQTYKAPPITIKALRNLRRFH